MRRIGPPAVPLLPEGLPDLLPGLVWTTDTALHLTHVAGDDLRRVGPALEALRLPSDDPRALVGRSIADLRLGPDAVRAHELALAGERASYTVEWGGVCWLARVKPLLAGGAVVGVTGMAVEEERRAPMSAFALCRAAQAFPPLGIEAGDEIAEWGERVFRLREMDPRLVPVLRAAGIIPPRPAAPLPPSLPPRRADGASRRFLQLVP